MPNVKTKDKIIQVSKVENIGMTQSAKRAKRIMEEVAVAGGYSPTSINGGFVVYERKTGTTIESVTATKQGEKKFLVTRSVKEVPSDINSVEPFKLVVKK